MKKIGLFYWPLKGNVEAVAKKIKEQYGDADIDIIDLSKADPKHLFHYENLIMGCSTVGADSWEHYTDDNIWYQFLHKMEDDKVDLNGKKLAIYGLGDQMRYPYNFVDGMERVFTHLNNHNITQIAQWPNEGLTFKESEALHNNMFRGLAIDLDNDEDEADANVAKWVEMINKEI
ncbi:MAG: flavodoxin domain-containing protein [Bacteroidales bacterium]|nr:flavodoxin domain-containing protein [Bacteroidales bacterium]